MRLGWCVVRKIVTVGYAVDSVAVCDNLGTLHMPVMDWIEYCLWRLNSPANAS